MPRGGKRQGSGRKPKTAKQHFLSGNAGKRKLSLVPSTREDAAAPEEAAEVVMPVDLLAQEGEQAYWQRYAPLAIEAGTLTPKSVGGFILLCQVSARADLLWESIESDGLTSLTEHGMKAHPLLPAYRGLIQRQESLLQRYLLAAMAKVDGGAGGQAPKEDDDVAALRQLMAIK